MNIHFWHDYICHASSWEHSHAHAHRTHVGHAMVHIVLTQFFVPSVFTESALALKEILLGHVPKVKSPEYSNRLRNTEASLMFLFKFWIDERLTRKDGSVRKRNPKEVITLRLCAALFSYVVSELQGDNSVEQKEIDYLITRFLTGPSYHMHVILTHQ